MMENYNTIYKKLQEFSKKYYLNKIVKGSILFLILFIIISFFVLLIENQYYLNVKYKNILLISYFIVLLLFSAFNILIPVLKWFGVVRGISLKKVNSIIVEHFEDIKDILWNIIELKNDKKLADHYSFELINSSIDQKIEKIKLKNFKDAIDFKNSSKYLIYLLIVIFVSIIYFLTNSENIKSSSKRLINYNLEYEKPSPYHFQILNDSLEVGKGDHLILMLKVNSKIIVKECYLFFGGNKYLMMNDSLNVYKYKFSNINNSIDFYFQIENFKSPKYKILVNEKPIISGFKIEVQSPLYTNEELKKYENLSDLIVPVGSQCKFIIDSYETDSVFVKINNQDSIIIEKADNDQFIFNHTVLEDAIYSFSIKNENFKYDNLFKISIEIIKDEYPEISVNQIIDSIKLTTCYFKGFISDDYGFKTLSFNTKIGNRIDSIYFLPLERNSIQQYFYFSYNFNTYKNSSKEISYFFEVFDNDQINGSKKSTSEIFVFNFPDIEKLFKSQDNEYKNIEELVEKSKNLSEEIKVDIFNMQQKLLNSELTDWEKKEALVEINRKREKLESVLSEISENNEKLNNYLESYSETEGEIFKKQEEIQKLLENVLTDELKKLLDEFNKMIANINQNNVNQLKEKMDISLNDLEKQLDRNLELLKRMQVEQKITVIKEKIDEVIKKNNESLSNLEKKRDANNQTDIQQNLKKEVEVLADEYDEIKELNENLEEKINLLDFKNEFNNVDKEFINSIEKLKNNKTKAGIESIKKNQENLENLSFLFQQIIQSEFEKQNAESIENLYQILYNLLVLSFDQEKAINTDYNEFFTGLVMNKQKKIKENFIIIQDSIYSLSKREPAINTIVNKEMVTIQNHLAIIDKELNDGNVSIIKSHQQIVLTSINNLSLFMNEVIKQLQKQMAGSQGGSQNCKKPGNNPNSNSQNSLKEMQQSIQKQLESMMKMMKEGKDGRSLNNELGKMLSQQEKMQNMLKEIMNGGNIGSSAYEKLKQAEQLIERLKQDILKNNISNETINKQREILTRLLEVENAENERDQEERRKSVTSKNQFYNNPKNYFDNTNSINNFEEQLMKNKLILKYFYQNKYQNYLFMLDSINGKAN